MKKQKRTNGPRMATDEMREGSTFAMQCTTIMFKPSTASGQEITRVMRETNKQDYYYIMQHQTFNNKQGQSCSS
jgi:anthranilate/para-aminobenzoate synthase component I